MTAGVAAQMSPIALPERIEVIDIVRGAALFGILASNMRAFNSPLAAYMDHSLLWQEPVDRAVQGLVDVFITGKFITIFSFLFGLGFAVMMERTEARGLPLRGLYFRRLLALLAFGLVHLVFFWFGDILAPYALMGFVLYWFRHSSSRKVLMWAGALYAWPLFINAFTTLIALTGVPMQGPQPPTPEQLAATIHAYSSGSYAELFQERMKENVFMLFALIFFYPRFLGMFLLGLLVWRKGLVRSLSERKDLLVRCRNWGLAVGLPLNVAASAMTEAYHPDPLGYSPLILSINALWAVGTPFLSLFYVAQTALLVRSPEWLARLRPFEAVGRTALSNYLLQTLICTTIFYSYGLGLYGKVGPAVGLLLTLAIYAALLAASAWWVKRFAFGPMEWVWRSVTYLRRPPFAL